MHPFDELAKGLAKGLSRREALRRVGSGLAGAVLASLGLAKPASATPVTRASCLAACGAQSQGCRAGCDFYDQYLRFEVTQELIACRQGCTTDACRSNCEAIYSQYIAEIEDEHTACGVYCGQQGGVCQKACYSLR